MIKGKILEGAPSKCTETDPTDIRFWEITEEQKKISLAKNSDYAKEDDKWANFRLCEMQGTSAWQGCTIRLGDKVSRLLSFYRKGTYEVKDESFMDTCVDCANYAEIGILLYEEDETPEEMLKNMKNPPVNTEENLLDLSTLVEECRTSKYGVEIIMRRNASMKGVSPWQYAVDKIDVLYTLLCNDIDNLTEDKTFRRFSMDIAVAAIYAAIFWEEETKLNANKGMAKRAGKPMTCMPGILPKHLGVAVGDIPKGSPINITMNPNFGDLMKNAQEQLQNCGTKKCSGCDDK